jgi:polyferredoxin
MVSIAQVQKATQPVFYRRWDFWRKFVQGGFLLAALVAGVRPLVVHDAPSIEATCPFGALETAWSALAHGDFLRNLGLGNVIVLLAVLASALLLGRIFCGWACPIGTLQDALAGLMRRLAGREIALPLHLPRQVDRVLRWGKALVLGWVLWASLSAVVPPLSPFCPYRTLFEFSGNALMSWGVLLMLATLSLAVERFGCRYLCPFGVVLALLNRLSPFRPRIDVARCVTCGRCSKACPMNIDPAKDGTAHPECVRCYACVQACRRPGAMRVDHV